ncbi:hypothetical protein CEXT_425451 [Caerostris extrusa]|uniref:Uncharacterized protein n=1 Tax=Caerostris extrusa TaxID=172846 RepID=A0AAV4YBN7_CAEEX|nr:hypothetical protein CEXT_425451 [Caerostris extrusa]
MIEFTSKMTIRLFRDLGGVGGGERNGTLKGAIKSDSGILPPPLSRFPQSSHWSIRYGIAVAVPADEAPLQVGTLEAWTAA